MRKCVYSIFSVLFLLGLCCCSGSNGGDNQQNEVANDAENVVRVKTAAELLAAIGSNKHIFVESDEPLNLTAALNVYPSYDESMKSTKEVSGVYSTHEFDGLSLIVFNVENLIIEGKSPEKAHLQATPRYADVFRFVSCDGIQLKNLKMGHTETGDCVGDVVVFESSQNATVEGCKLYGCGVNGLTLLQSQKIDVKTSDIYKCSSCFLDMEDAKYINFIKCEMSDCVGTINARGDIREVIFTDCKIHNNKAELLPQEGIAFDNCEAYDNEGELGDGEYDGEEEADPYDEEQANRTAAANNHFGAPADNMSALSRPRKEKKVKTAKEFLNAIKSDVTIIIDCDGVMDLSEEIGKLPEVPLADDGGSGVYNSNGELTLVRINNLVIEGKSNDPEKTHIVVKDSYANVFYTKSCDNIQFRNLKLGHQVPGECDGNVLYLVQNNNVEIDNCKLYGCGVTGLVLSACKNVNVTKSEIYECSESVMRVHDACNNVLLNECILRDCPEGFYVDGAAKKIEVRKSHVSSNETVIRGDGPLKFTDVDWFY